MIFSELKIREMGKIPNTISLEKIKDAINSIGFEVEEVIKFSDVSGVMFGKVLKTFENPNANNLNVCEILFKDKKRIIQTSANNVKEEDIIVAFVPGSKKGNFVFREKELMGIISEGMLASLDELGFSAELLSKKYYDNIFIVDSKVSINDDPIKYFGLNDNLIDISILTNRSDAFSYEIMSKEIAAFFGIKISNKKNIINSDENLNDIKIVNEDKESFINGFVVEIENEKLSDRDLFFILKNNISLSEMEIENIFYVFYLYSGVSFRLFDKSKLSKTITLKKNKSLWEFWNGKKPISLAGVEIYEDFKIHKKTKKIFVEMSSLETKIVRDNAKLKKVQTISSNNCSRVISYGSMEMAKNIVFSYFKKHSDLLVKSPLKNTKINFDKTYLEEYVGNNIYGDKNYIKSIESLKILNFKFNKNKISVPEYRHDVKTMQDMVEEIMRFYGFNNIIESKPELIVNEISKINDFSKQLYFMDYLKLNSYTLVSKEETEFNPFNFKKNISLMAFTSKEHAYVRNTISVSLANIYSENKKRKIQNFNFFDIGMINNKRAVCFGSDKKEFKEIIADFSKIINLDFEIQKKENDFLHPNYSASILVNNKEVGWIGKFHPKFLIDSPIFIEMLIPSKKVKKVKNIFSEFNPSPLKQRDITIEIKENETLKNFINKIEKIDGIFDYFEIDRFVVDQMEKITFRFLIEENTISQFDKEFNK